MFALGEAAKWLLLCAGFAMAAAPSTSVVPHMVVTGAALLLSSLLLAWFCHPAGLSDAYRHLRLQYSGQWRLLGALCCGRASLLALVADGVGFVLLGFLAIVTARGGMAAFAAVAAATFGGCATAVLWSSWLLASRIAELRLSGTMLALAAWPLHLVLTGAVLVAKPSTGVCSAALLGSLLACCVELLAPHSC